MGSYRKRAKLPVDEMREKGIKADINGGNADIVVFGKPGPFHHESDTDMAREFKEKGAKVVVDICDDHLNHPTLGPIYDEMMSIADLVTCPSSEMKRILWEEAGVHATVIDDPYHEEERLPHATGNRALWFGHQKNMNLMTAWRDKLDGYDLEIITGPNEVPGTVPWSEEKQTEMLSEANVVILPTSPQGYYKSNNKLVDAVRAGCFVIAGDHPEHYAFRQMCWVGNIWTGCCWAHAFQKDLNDLVQAAQDYVAHRYSPENIAKQWIAALGKL